MLGLSNTFFNIHFFIGWISNEFYYFM